MSDYIPVDGYPDLVRDKNTNMILNINKGNTDAFIEKRDRELHQRQEIETLKSDVQDIKMMLQKLTESFANA
tara:strand:- start:298 stop:513 length:216 start_codon:yes stop_codon:yes gene_type:complete